MVSARRNLNHEKVVQTGDSHRRTAIALVTMPEPSAGAKAPCEAAS